MVSPHQVPNSISAWLKPLSGGNSAIAFLNENDQGRPNALKIKLGDLGLKNANGYNITEVFDGKPMGVFKPSSDLDVLIDPTSILLLKAAPL